VDVTTLPTPALVIDAAIVRRNVERMAAYAREHALGVRPHTKTHKSLRLAAMQLAAGAVGLTVAKAGEAEAMAQAGRGDAPADLLVAYPALDPSRANRLARLARRATVRVAVDSAYAAEALAEAAERANGTIGILVDVDVGMGRTGVQSPVAALALAQKVDSLPGLRLDGIMIYPGHVWDPPDAQAPALAAVAVILGATLALWRENGFEARIVSGGSTPTAYQSHLIPGLTEIRPGTYVFNDMNALRGGFCGLNDCAARIVCTVVSEAVPGQVVIDAGSKTLTSDRCIPAPESGHGLIVEYPDARITKLSEEHGQVDVTACSRRPRVGERVTVVPNHICPCVNLHDAAWWLEPGEPPESLVVDARGRTS